MNTKPTTLSDMIGKTISVLGKEFTINRFAPKGKDNSKIMVQSEENVIYYIGDENEALFDVISEISNELKRLAKISAPEVE